MGADDASLLRDHRHGRPGATEELARRALRVSLRTVTAMLGDRDLAADVAQDAAIDVVRGAHRIRDPATLDAWIHRIAVRHAMRAVKRARHRQSVERPLDEITPVVEAGGLGDTTHRIVERRELAATVRAALTTLPPKQRMALALRYVHDMSYEQIADAMGERVSNVGVLISRGKAALGAIDALRDRVPSTGADR